MQLQTATFMALQILSIVAGTQNGFVHSLIKMGHVVGISFDLSAFQTSFKALI